MKKVILAIIDGFGENKNSYGNAYLESSHPALDFIYENYSYSLLEASGVFVGLPKGQREKGLIREQLGELWKGHF